ANTGFTIPKDFYFSVSYYGQNRIRQGNMTMGAMHFLGVSLKKSFAQKRWTLSLSAENLLATDVKMSVVSEAV
ncbi:outer membrane beta-barrel protein, partial [Acinetobacter baumannii]|nr:outer membrane beta-barrel protein [Acinetobacter baumannii]